MVVVVHGCFWHRHTQCDFADTPKSNLEFWIMKFSDDVARDRRTTAALKRLGWRVITVWECELASPDKLRSRRRCATRRELDLLPMCPEFTTSWSGRLDSNQRPPAPKSAVWRFPAMVCETTIRLKLLMSNHLTHVIAGHCIRQIASWNPAGTPQRSHFLARYRTMTPCFGHDSAQWVSLACDTTSLDALLRGPRIKRSRISPNRPLGR